MNPSLGLALTFLTVAALTACAPKPEPIQPEIIYNKYGQAVVTVDATGTVIPAGDGSLPDGGVVPGEVDAGTGGANQNRNQNRNQTENQNQNQAGGG